jgi:hypothetical protein
MYVFCLEIPLTKFTHCEGVIIHVTRTEIWHELNRSVQIVMEINAHVTAGEK